MDRTKYKNVITNVLSTVETERVVDNIQNTKFSIFIGETSDICNDFSSSIPNLDIRHSYAASCFN